MAEIIMNEANFDLYIYNLLREADIHSEAQALINEASKSQTGESGRADFIARVKDYILIIEDKADRDKLLLRDDDKTISLTQKATKDYALNGALFYARKLLEQNNDSKIFAFGCAGDSKHHTMKPLFVSKDLVKELPEISTFENFSPDNIELYYTRAVLELESDYELELSEILKKARELHEHLRNYGKLGDSEKPLVVAAILLALREQDYGFRLEQLTGDDVDTDGKKLYAQVENSLTRARVSPEVKRERVLNQFTLIKDRPILNTKYEFSETEFKTPLKYFAEYINREIYSAIKLDKSPEDYLGRFYGEFVRYSGGDGQTLGVVLTPSHITELFCDLVNLTPDDVIFDPCCGTGGFLIAGMHRMLKNAKSDSQRKLIKQSQIYGIEIRDDMFSIATTNMILRGDGQSNLTCEDFLTNEPSDLQIKLKATAGFMNPPYSQAKNKATQNLSELNFIYHLLESLLPGGRAAVIVPVSAMIGKTKEDKQLKSDILKHHTLEGVISLNKNTFYGIGTVPCIAIFTAGEKHSESKLAKFINFEDDGWEVKKHLGLIETERAKDRRQYLLDCWNGKIKDYPSSFMVETTIEAGDEWLHSFYYYNDEIPTEQDFINSIADYLTFEANMIFHGRGYLFEPRGHVRECETKKISLEGRSWERFEVGQLFDIMPGRCSNASNLEHDDMGVPYVGATNRNNGVLDLVRPVNELMMKGNCIAFVKQGEGSVGYSVYKHEDFIASTSIAAGYAPFINKYTGIFITTVADKVRGKYNFNYSRSDTRLKKELIQLPTDSHGQPDYSFMEDFIRYHEQELINTYIENARVKLRNTPPPEIT